jgi:hypothetical protein
MKIFDHNFFAENWQKSQKNLISHNLIKTKGHICPSLYPRFMGYKSRVKDERQKVAILPPPPETRNTKAFLHWFARKHLLCRGFLQLLLQVCQVLSVAKGSLARAKRGRGETGKTVKILLSILKMPLKLKLISLEMIST